MPANCSPRFKKSWIEYAQPLPNKELLLMRKNRWVRFAGDRPGRAAEFRDVRWLATFEGTFIYSDATLAEQESPQESQQGRAPAFPLRYRAAVISVLILGVGLAIGPQLLDAGVGWTIAGLIGLIVGGNLLSFAVLRCPHCGWWASLSPSTWSMTWPGHHCRRCSGPV